jgi:hypothetical protein
MYGTIQQSFLSNLPNFQNYTMYNDRKISFKP